MKTKDGKSRQFAFIGFRTEQEAETALNYFNNSYLDTCRITCEVARKVGDPNMPRPWSRYSVKKQEELTKENKKSTGSKSSKILDSKGNTENSKKGSEKNDLKLQEFLQVMQPRSKSKLWANDELGAPFLDQNGKVDGKQNMSGKGGRKQTALVEAEFNENDETENEPSDYHATKHSHDLARDEVVSDTDYFKSRVKKDWPDSESEEDDDDRDNSIDEKVDGELLDAHKGATLEEKVEKEAPSEQSDGEMVAGELSSELKDEKEEVLKTGRLFVRNLPYSATEEELVELFSKFGDVSQVHIVVDKDTKRSKGIAYVLYSLSESANRALEELDNSIFQGRLLHIMPSKQRIPSETKGFDVNQEAKTFKQRREEQKKATEASGDTRAWNSLFMRPDTVCPI
uniref:RRM domain-containing protein n=1 Tax=Nelumbo nucifera TaxID=4432 RepID=A0A822XZY6_NELNU|nr:TPA_asm: hypothetical protein HUJ06_025819 [Nelumbo nucifera]